MRKKLALVFGIFLTASALAGCGREMPTPAETGSTAAQETEAVAVETVAD